MHKKVIFSYGEGLLIATISALGIYESATFINNLNFVTKTHIIWIQVVSLIPGATALFGRLGYEIQTWNGETTEEKFNAFLDKFLSWLGFAIALFSLLLKPIS